MTIGKDGSEDAAAVTQLKYDESLEQGRGNMGREERQISHPSLEGKALTMSVKRIKCKCESTL